MYILFFLKSYVAFSRSLSFFLSLSLSQSFVLNKIYKIFVCFSLSLGEKEIFCKVCSENCKIDSRCLTSLNKFKARSLCVIMCVCVFTALEINIYSLFISQIWLFIYEKYCILYILKWNWMWEMCLANYDTKPFGWVMFP